MWSLVISLLKENVLEWFFEVVSIVVGCLIEVELYEVVGEFYEDINVMKEVSIFVFILLMLFDFKILNCNV